MLVLLYDCYTPFCMKKQVQQLVFDFWDYNQLEILAYNKKQYILVFIKDQLIVKLYSITSRVPWGIVVSVSTAMMIVAFA